MSFIRSRFPQLYRFAAIMSLLAMLTPLGVMLVHQPAMAQAVIHICGADQQNYNGHDKAPAHKLPNCPICHNLHLLGHGLTPPDAVVGTDRVLVASPPVVFVSDFIPAPVSVALPPSRAPPVLV